MGDTFGISFGVGNLRASNGSIVPDGSLVIAVADTSGQGTNGLLNLSPSTPVAPGSLIGSGNLILNLNMFPNHFPLDGYFLGEVYQTLTSPLATGQDVYILWFPQLTLAATTVGAGTEYGIFGGSIGTSYSVGEGGNPWTIPVGGAFVSMYADEAENFGSVPQSLLTAKSQAIPEPSTITLEGMGLVAVFAIRMARVSSSK